MTAAQAATCVILPTRNEEANITEVLRRIDALGVCGEIVVVDDSDDNTVKVANQAARHMKARLKVLHRTGKQRDGGLSTAIVMGIACSAAPQIVVMDADLQHPPELIPLLLEQLSHADLAIASRFNWENVIAGLSPIRRLGSRSAGALAFWFFPGALRDLKDPMSGFFACSRTSLTPSRLKPMGYKILLEILGTHPEISFVEVPFSFGARSGGASKAGLREGFRYFRHLFDLRQRQRLAAPTSITTHREFA